MVEKGTRCLAFLGDAWVDATVKRRNEDGSFDIVPAGHEDDFMEVWQGLTQSELSFDDEALWPPVFDALRGAEKGIGRAEARKAFESLGLEVEDQALSDFWTKQCGEICPGKDAASLVLDRAQSYRVFAGSGYSAKQLADPSTHPSKDLFKLFWNQVRMGGRDPSEVGRTITLDDTLESLHLTKARDDAKTKKALAAFEKKQKITLPRTLKQLWSKTNADGAILDSHCNNPETLDVKQFELRRGKKKDPWGARLAVQIMVPHQGDHAWWAIFDDGAEDAEIWISFEEEKPPVRRVATSLAFFFWDLAETGRCWELGGAEEDAEDG